MINNDFKKGVQKSLLIHGAILAFIFVTATSVPKKPVILQSSVRVDLVALPDFTKKELRQAALAEIQSKTKEPITKINEKKEKPKEKGSLKNAIDRIKALEKIEESVRESAKKKNQVVAKGNILSKGSSLAGSQGDLYNEYADQMKTKLQNNWDLPIWLARQKLSAQVVMILDKYGNVINTTFIRSSGNKHFDEQVLKAIRVSQPFGSPPADIVENGVQLGFPL